MKQVQIKNNIGSEFDPNVVLMGNLFDHDSKMQILSSIRHYGIDRTRAGLVAGGMKPTVAKAMIRNIIRKYGW